MRVFEKASYICLDFDSPMVFAFRLLSVILGSGHSQEATSGDEQADQDTDMLLCWEATYSNSVYMCS